MNKLATTMGGAFIAAGMALTPAFADNASPINNAHSLRSLNEFTRMIHQHNPELGARLDAEVLDRHFLDSAANAVNSGADNFSFSIDFHNDYNPESFEGERAVCLDLLGKTSYEASFTVEPSEGQYIVEMDNTQPVSVKVSGDQTAALCLYAHNQGGGGMQRMNPEQGSPAPVF